MSINTRQQKRPDNEYQVCSYRLEIDYRNDTNATFPLLKCNTSETFATKTSKCNTCL